jgi:hypothetical protein
MRTLATLLLILALATQASAQVNGDLEVIDGKSVLTVWGTHHERGYAQGYLAGDGVKAMFDDYMIGYLCAGSAFMYGLFRGEYVASYTVDADYLDEANGILAGMVDAGVSLHNGTIGRDVDVTDLLACNAIVDIGSALGLAPFACSSLSSWGTSTVDDPVLAGNHIITRHLDWTKHPALRENAILIVQLPSEPDEQAWLSMTCPGFMGSLSGINESGVGAFLNMGNNSVGTAGAPYHPILLTVRNGVEAADYDESGECSPDDVIRAIEDKSQFGGYIVHATKNEGAGSRPVIIECNNENGVAVRDVTDNTLVAGENLLATNHFRALYPPVYCSRYYGVVNALNVSTAISPERSWQVMADHAGSFSSNIQAMQYIESEGRLAWAIDTATEPAYMQEPTLFDIDELFDTGSGIDESVRVALLHQNRPNPFSPRTDIAYTIPGGAATSGVTVNVYDVTGRLVRRLVEADRSPGTHSVTWDGRDEDGGDVASGVYFCRITWNGESEARRMVLLR